jgi:hypothetical protein
MRCRINERYPADFNLPSQDGRFIYPGDFSRAYARATHVFFFDCDDLSRDSSRGTVLCYSSSYTSVVLPEEFADCVVNFMVITLLRYIVHLPLKSALNADREIE